MHQDREIRQESYLATKYEKARQDVGLFFILSFLLNMIIFLTLDKQSRPLINTTYFYIKSKTDWD
ncbi:hypothetical protein MWQ_06876 [Acinetobacter seifertii]|nr:hypothetical protein MWQ_06876 [Acinetobacter seifertii]